MTDDLLDVIIGWLFAAVAAASAMVGTTVTEPAPAPAVQELDRTPVPSITEGLGSLGYLPCDTPTGPQLPCYWDGDEGAYVIDTLGGTIPLEGTP